MNAGGPRTAGGDLALDVARDLGRGLRALCNGSPSAPPRRSARLARDVGVVGPPALADLAPTLRPIGAAMVFSGFDPAVDRELRQALCARGRDDSHAAAPGRARRHRRRASRPASRSASASIRGDLEMGATGTVTYVDGSRVYAFGHPFLNLGPTQFAMTRAHVYAVLPSLDSSLKIASLGPVIGTMTQDRATAIGGTLGARPARTRGRRSRSLGNRGAGSASSRSTCCTTRCSRRSSRYVAMLNALDVVRAPDRRAVDRRDRHASRSATTARSTIDDVVHRRRRAVRARRPTLTAPIGAAVDERVPQRAARDARPHAPRLRAAARARRSSASGSTRRGRSFGATHTLQVQLRDYRGATRNRLDARRRCPRRRPAR